MLIVVTCSRPLTLADGNLTTLVSSVRVLGWSKSGPGFSREGENSGGGTKRRPSE